MKIFLILVVFLSLITACQFRNTNIGKNQLDPHHTEFYGGDGFKSESGKGPRDFAHDGNNVWLTHFAENSVSVWNSDRRLIATHPVGNNPRPIIFGKNYIWVGNTGENSVVKVDLQGSIVDRFFIGGSSTEISDILFDGVDIWIAASWGNSLTKITTDGEIIFTKSVPGFHPSPWALAFDGEYVWLACIGSENIYKFNESGDIVGDFQVIEHKEITQDELSGPASIQGAWAGGPSDILFDGKKIWVTVPADNTVILLTLSGEEIDRFQVIGMPMNLTLDDDSIWITQFSNDSVYQGTLFGKEIGTYKTGDGPYGLSVVNGKTWVANFQENTVSFITGSQE